MKVFLNILKNHSDEEIGVGKEIKIDPKIMSILNKGDIINIEGEGYLIKRKSIYFNSSYKAENITLNVIKLG